MRKTVRSSAAITGTITILTLGITVLSPVIVTVGVVATAGLLVVSVMPSGVVYRLASSIADIQLAMGRTMARKVWSNMR